MMTRAYVTVPWTYCLFMDELCEGFHATKQTPNFRGTNPGPGGVHVQKICNKNTNN